MAQQEIDQEDLKILKERVTKELNATDEEKEAPITEVVDSVVEIQEEVAQGQIKTVPFMSAEETGIERETGSKR